MSLTHIHENDLGTEFVVQVVDAVTGSAIDLTGYTTTEILFERPDGTTVTKTATISDAANGKIKYVSEAVFLTPPGVWRLQGHVIHTGASPAVNHKTEVLEFKVHANIL